MSGVFLKVDGGAVDAAITSRMVVTSAAALARIPTVIAVAYGIAKCSAVLAALDSGMVQGLVTHSGLARALLAERS